MAKGYITLAIQLYAVPLLVLNLPYLICCGACALGYKNVDDDVCLLLTS